MRLIKRFCMATVFCMGWVIQSPVFSQSENDVIINEILHGATYKDAVELLVIKPGGVDMRGWILTDLFSPTATLSTSEGTLTLPQNPFLSNVSQFTRVVLIADAGGATLPIAVEDTIASGDSTLVLLPVTLGGLLLHNGTNRFNLASNDNVVLLTGPNLTTGSVIDIMSYGGDISGWTGAAWRNNLSLPSGVIAYFTNDSIDGYNNNNGASGKGWNSGIAEANHTLGRINPGQLTGGKPIRIRNIIRNPISPNSAQPVIISASVGSLNAISSVRTIYYYDLFTDSVEMSFVSDSTYRNTIPVLPKNKKVFYFVKAVDSGNNVKISAIDSFTVTPSIVFAQITRSPLTPDSNQAATITAKISSFNPVTSVKLLYAVNRTADSISMTKVSDTTYQGVIPAKKVGDTVSYYIRVIDNAGQVELSSTSQYIVLMPIEITSISSIQGDTSFYKGKTVTISGIIVIGDRVLRTDRRSSYIVDRSNGVSGIQISTTGFPGDTLKRGDSVIVKGMISQFQGTTQIGIPTGGSIEFTIVSRNNPLPPATARNVTQISDVNREGEWVKIKGNVNSKSSAGGGDNIVVEDGAGTITVRIWNTTGVVTGAIAIGSTYTFKGIIGLYLSGTQLLTAYNEDIVPDTAGSGDFSTANLKVSPYPFNPMAGEVIRYALRFGNDSRIIVRLFDLSGRLVTTLVDQVKAAGRDETRDPLDARTWNGRATETRQLVPVGTYLMHLEVTNRKTGKTSTKTAPIVIGTKLK